MRASILALALPAVALAQQQVPFLDQVKGWFAKASDSITSAITSASAAASSVSIPDPVASGAAALAQLSVTRVTLDNYKDVLKPGAATATPGIEEWMLMVTGGNKTCFGLCVRAEKAWNESVVLMGASRSPPHLGLLDCETDPVLCNAWALGPPTVMHMLLPQPLPDQSTPATTVRYALLNRTTITAPEIAALHLQEKYLELTPYEGIWHPFDGQLAKLGLGIPFGWASWGLTKIPSWSMMIAVSFLSRSMMSGRMNPQRRGQGGAAAPAAAAQ